MGVLRHFGFRPNDNPLFSASLIYRFDNFDLEAALTVNKYSQERIFFSGLLNSTTRILYEPIEFFIVPDVMCVWQCAALLAYYLRDYPIPNPPWWLDDGRHRRDLLPWAIADADRRAAHDALQKCFIERAWLRLALKSLLVQIAAIPDDVPVVFEFKDAVLSIRCNGNSIVVPGLGVSWPNQATILARELRTLPKRLMTENVCVLVDASHLRIGNSFYNLATNVTDGSKI
jgi:hypothetical protein